MNGICVKYVETDVPASLKGFAEGPVETPSGKSPKSRKSQQASQEDEALGALGSILSAIRGRPL